MSNIENSIVPGASYDSGQFYNFDKRGIAGPGGLDRGGRRADNPTNEEFAWPGNHRHHLTISKNPGANTSQSVMAAQKIERGFIRLLPLSLERENGTDTSNLPNYRLFFQFNPQTINREVRMSENVYSPIMQTKEQLSQPMMGESTFSFDLMFDRTFELNRAIPKNQLNIGDVMAGISAEEGNKDLLTSLGPDRIGVLHDVRMLDAIVGQGITQEMVTFLTNRFAVYDALKGAEGEGTGVTEEVDEEGNTIVTTEGQPGTPTTIEEALNSNVGNQAFLLPNPVRVVFSSLFMVDGFVTSMAVRYVKFNTDMVPMMALINIQMSAVYFGFARANTAFTDALRQADVTSITSATSESLNPESQSEKDLDDLFQSCLTKFFVHVGGTDDSDTPNLWHEKNGGVSQLTSPPTHYKNDSDLSVRSVIGYDDNKVLIAAGFRDIPDNEDNDPVLQALKDGWLKSIVLRDFSLVVLRSPFSDREATLSDGVGVDTYDPVMINIQWDTSALTNDGFSASGSSPLKKWREAQHQKDGGGGTMEATIARPSDKPYSDPEAERLFFEEEEDMENFFKNHGKLLIRAEVWVDLTHDDGKEWRKPLSIERSVESWQNILVTLKPGKLRPLAIGPGAPASAIIPVGA